MAVGQTLAAEVRALRTDKGLSREKLGAIAHCSYGTIDRIERKGEIPRLKTLRNIAVALGVPPRHLLDLAIADDTEAA